MRTLPRHLLSAILGALLLAACTDAGNAPSPDGAAQKPSTAESPLRSPAADSPVAAEPDSCGGPHAQGSSADACGAPAESCGDESAAANDTIRATAPQLRRVPADQVCMRSNRFMGKAQPAADVDGHAYHGCCAGCTKHLAESAAARTAKDPVTGNAVDKATAVIGARPDGSVVYFESAETFARGGGA